MPHAARFEIRVLRRAKQVLRPLMRDRAIREINRPGGLRFVPVNAYRAEHPMLAAPHDRFEESEPTPDAEAATAELERLGLEGQINDLAYVLALEKAAPLEALDQAKMSQVRITRQELERRAGARRAAPSVTEGAVDAEFVEVASDEAAP